MKKNNVISVLIILSGLLYGFRNAQKETLHKKSIQKRCLISTGKKDINDTTTFEYLDQKFNKNKETYIGREFQTLLDDVKTPFRSYAISPKFEDIKHIAHLSLYFESDMQVGEKIRKRETLIKLVVTFRQPISQDSAFLILKKSIGNKWTKNEVDFYGEKLLQDFNFYSVK